MKIIEPYVVVEKFNPAHIMRSLERYGRVCYKSEGRITSVSAAPFLKGLIERGHESVLEHEKITATFVVDRGVSHEIVRHRIASYSQESTRYCNYGGEGIAVIEPFFFKDETYDAWLTAMINAEVAYQQLIALGRTPQEARAVLPNSLKTEIVVTYNIREWRHFFRLRAQKNAHPQIQQVAIPLLLCFQEWLPALFGDIDYNRSFPPEHYAEVHYAEVREAE